MRRRNVKKEVNEDPESQDLNVTKIVQQLDAFPKLPTGCAEQSVRGASLSIVTFFLIFILICSEIYHYWDTEMHYSYEVDKDHENKLRLNIDITVNMKCQNLGPDVLDATGQDLSMGHQNLQQDDVAWEMDSDSRLAFESLRTINRYIRSHIHALTDIVWKRRAFYWNALFNHESKPSGNGETTACRIHGSLLLNKIAGNLHIVAGKSVSLGDRGHAHFAMMMSARDYNFSHRINHFSFGDAVTSRASPLDAEERIVYDTHHMFQYFIQVVPTYVNTRQAVADTYQYAVTDQNRSIDHNQGSHGTPGIFFKYDVTSLKVSIVEKFQPFLTFLVRLAGLVGGLFATSGLLNMVIDIVTSLICCRTLKLPLDVPVADIAGSSGNPLSG